MGKHINNPLKALESQAQRYAPYSPQNVPEGIFQIVVRVKNAQKECSSLKALRIKSSGIPKEMGSKEQNIGEKGTSEKVPRSLHSNRPQIAGQALSCEWAEQA